MAQQRLAMRKIKDILRFHLLAGVTSCRRIARASGCGKTAVAERLQGASVAGLTSWDLAKSDRAFLRPPVKSLQVVAGELPAGQTVGTLYRSPDIAGGQRR